MSNKIFNKGMAVASLMLLGLIFTGCSTAKIPITIRMPGELKLTGISKLAMVDFNSIGSQPNQGIFEADPETLAIVQGKVCAAFAKSKTYAVARLDAEKQLQDDYKAGRLSPKTRFDGIVYGSVWWQVSPEYSGEYPMKCTLSHWENVSYMKEEKGKMKERKKTVITRSWDELAMLPFRAWNANLMLSLAVYKMDHNGNIQKLAETYTIATQKYLMKNGSFSEQQEVLIANLASRKDNIAKASEKKSVWEKMKGGFKDFVGEEGKRGYFPTELQVKFELAEKLTSDLAAKLMPNDSVMEIEVSKNDDKLFYMLRDGAFLSGINYSNDTIEKGINKLSKGTAAKVKKELQELQEVEETSNVPYDVSLSKVAISGDTRNFIEDNIEYFFARGLCHEASGNAQDALRDYRLAFHFVPTKESANGISRCLFALDMAKEVKKTNKDVRKSTKKARLD